MRSLSVRGMEFKKRNSAVHRVVPAEIRRVFIVVPVGDGIGSRPVILTAV